ncbi:MAG: pseudouridine synthase [Elusimicrobiota bacterium]
MALKAVLFNKPYGVVSQFSPLENHRTLADFRLPGGVYPAGRLDRDSEGLLVLTGDGGLQHALTDPRCAHPRTYLVQVERVPPADKLARLASGVRLRDGMTRPCAVRLLLREPELPLREPPIRHRKSVPTAWLEMILREGRNRQVRRMTAAISHPALRLVRSRVGDLTLKGLYPGRWRYATAGEMRRLRALAAGPPGDA